MTQLRDFQRDIKSGIYEAWRANARNVMGVAPTGAGKTVIAGSVLQELNAPACAIAHRQELVGQIAMALNREGVEHGIIAPDPIVKQIITLEMELFGASMYNPRAQVRVAGVDSLGRVEPSDPWVQSVALVLQDEGHHVLKDNKWGRAMNLFPNARGLFLTAHAVRGDGKGLGRHADGLVDQLVVGPSCRELIDRGFLTDYRLIALPDDTDLSDVNITPMGEFSPAGLRAAVHKNKHIVGDVVAHYEKFAAGKLGVTFAVDIEAATDIARAYQARGISAEVITADTPLAHRAMLMRRFRAREILQLVSVDVLGEGVDVPAIEVVSMARHTMSFQLYAQQFGRSLRTMVEPGIAAHWDAYTDEQRKAFIAASVKPKAIIIDHVNNWERHGLPDIPQIYSLDKRERRKRKAKDDAIPLRACLNPECLMPYEAVLPRCPHCGEAYVPQRRGSPEQVDGNLYELDPDVLKALRGEIARIDAAPTFPRDTSPGVDIAIRNRHHDRQQAQAALRHAMAVWMGWQAHQERETPEAQMRFYHQFKIDVLTAQTLSTADANTLRESVTANLLINNIVEAPP